MPAKDTILFSSYNSHLANHISRTIILYLQFILKVLFFSKKMALIYEKK